MHHFHHHVSVSSSPAYTPSPSTPQSSLPSPAHHGHLAHHHPPSIAALHDGITSIREEKEEDFSSSDSGDRAMSPGSAAPPYHGHHARSEPPLPQAPALAHTVAQQSPSESPQSSTSDPDPLSTPTAHPPTDEEVHDALYARYRQWGVAALKEHIKALSASHPPGVDSDDIQATLRSAMEKKDLIEMLIRLTPAEPTPQASHPQHHSHAHPHEAAGRGGGHEAKHGGWVDDGAAAGGPKQFTFTTGHPGNSAVQPQPMSSPTPSQSSPSTVAPATAAPVNRFTMVSPASQSHSGSGEHSPPLDSPVLGHFRRHHSLEPAVGTGVTYSASADDLNKMSKAGARAAVGAGVQGHHNGDDELKALEAFDPLYDVGQKTGGGEKKGTGGSG